MGNDLNSGLAGVKEHAKTVLPSEVLEVFDRDSRRTVDEAAFARVGDKIDDFALPGAAGEDVALGALVDGGPAVLVFYRGQWCPYCNLTLRTYQREVVPELAKFGATLVAISPQAPDGSLSAKEKNELDFEVLSDVGNVVARRFGLTFRVSGDVRAAMTAAGADLGVTNGTGEWELAHPAVAVVDANRTLRYFDVHPDYTTRTEPARILEALKSL